MLKTEKFPILEFDTDNRAKIMPSRLVEKMDVPECCVITFFDEVIERMKEEGRLQQISTFITPTAKLPIYQTDYHGKLIGIVLGFLGAAGAAGELEELIATGFKKFVVCGGAGVLEKGIQVGHLVVPYSAVRDEGVSYHYLKPSREVLCNERALTVIENQLEKEKIPFIKAKTWTTDAFYRETVDKIALRVSEGCITVEMEAAAFFAVSQFRKVTLGQILYGGDDLSGDDWDNRDWQSRDDIRENLVDLSFKICLEL